jgi:WD40 repeat protein
MLARHVFQWAAIILGLAVGGTALAQTAEVEAELRLRLAQLRAQQLQLQLKQAGQPQPKAAPKPPAPPSTMPGTVIARLGDSRLRHAAPPLCVLFSRDGKRLFSGGEDDMLRVWDATTGDPVSVLNFPSTKVTAIQFTPDGSRLAVQLADGQVRFLDPATLKPATTFTATQESGFAISPDGTLIAAVSPNGTLDVTELGTELVKLELTRGKQVEFHPNGKTLAVADDKGKVTFHMLAGGKPVTTIDHGSRLTGFAFRPDGKQIATGGPEGSGGGTVKVWDIAEGKDPKVVAEIEGNLPRAWLGTDRIAIGDGFTAGVYDLKAKKWVGRVKGVSGAWTVSPDGTKLAATGTGLRVRVWEVATGKQLFAENDTFPDAALLAPAPDGKSVFVLAGDAAFHWPVSKSTATPAGTLPGKAVVAAAGNGRLAVATPEGVLVYDDFDPTKKLPAKPSRTLSEHAAGCNVIAVSADGKKIAYCGDARKTMIADAATGKTIRVLSTVTKALALTFTPDGEKLAVHGRDGQFRLWAAKPVDGGYDGNLWQIRVQAGSGRGAAAVSPDGKLIAVAAGGVLKVVNAADGPEVFQVGGVFEHGPLMQVAFSADSRLVFTATGDRDGGIQVWEVATHSLVARLTTGFGTVNRIGLFADGSRVVSSGAEEVISLWDISGRHGKDVPKAEELLAAWGELDSLDGAKGVPAVSTLVAGGSKSFKAITAGMEEMNEARKKIAKWTKDLGSEDFKERETATKELTAQGVRALPALQAVVADTESPEAKKRAGEILDRFEARGIRMPANGLAGDALRLFRAVEVLEKVGGGEAKSLLTRIEMIGGPAGDAAKAALKRVK